MAVIHAINRFEKEYVGEKVKDISTVCMNVFGRREICYRIKTEGNGIHYFSLNNSDDDIQALLDVCEHVEYAKGLQVQACSIAEADLARDGILIKHFRCDCSRGRVFYLNYTTWEFFQVRDSKIRKG